MKKMIILLISIVFLATFMTSVSAETTTDPTGDVYHYRYTGGVYGWDYNVADKPNIDITDIAYTINGDQVTLTVTVAGTIANSELVSYWTYLNTSDSNYMFSWMNNEGIGWGTNTNEGSYQMDFEPDITVSGNTISATYDVVGTFSNPDVWGWAAEYTSYGDTNAEWWADWVPNDESPYYDEYSGDSGDTSGDDTDTGDTGSDDTGSTDSGETDSGDQNTNAPPPTGTPGFEFIFLIAAVGLLSVVLRKRR